IGRYAKVKGVDLLIEAFADFRKKFHRGSLYLLGGGPMRDLIEAQVAASGVSEFISVGSYANAETVVRFGKACDAMLIPSRNESIPVVLSDAAQLGLPVIVSNVGDMGSLVKESGAGLVFEKENVAELGGALEKFLIGGSTQFSVGIERLQSKFNLDETARYFLESINSPIDAGSSCKTDQVQR
ncbi:MAG: glycosyltransferase, partial [Planctomycetota bacterium]